jgi:putative ATP-binding cassette transporter
VNAQSKQPSLAGLILRSSPRLVWASIGLSLVAGLCYSLIVPYLMHNIAPGRPAGGGGLFFVLCAVTFVAKAGSLVSVTWLVKDLAARMRIRLCRKISNAAVQDVDGFGMARLTNILVEDIGNVSFAAVCLPMVAVQVTTVIGMLCYLAFLDWRVFVCTAAAIVAGLAFNRIPFGISMRYMERSRAIRDRVQAGVRGIVFGAYELKLSRAKARQFLEEEIAAPEREAARVDKIADTWLHCAGTFVELMSFFIIGLVAFVLPRFIQFLTADVYAIVMTLFYVVLPIMMTYILLPNIQRGAVALRRIQELELLDEEPEEGAPLGDWSTLEVRDLAYRYHAGADGAAGFALKPVSLRFRKGEVVFVVGGNGSGKSTLGKLLSLHYAAAAGTVSFDGTRITSANVAAAREKIAVVYSNYYLFERLYGEIGSEREATVRRLLEMLGLAEKVRFADGRFSTTSLSDGQRRRLALVVALADDRDIYLLDEWAADQDPEFREAFYTRILRQMRAAGKLVIVITHDDRYFQYADRVVVMEYGGVREEIVQPARDAAVPAATPRRAGLRERDVTTDAAVSGA